MCVRVPFSPMCIGDHHQLHITSLESSKTKEGKVVSADIVGQQQPNNNIISSDSITSTSDNVQSNHPAQWSTSEMDRESSDCIYIALYNYEAQTQEDLTFQKGIYTSLYVTGMFVISG